MIGSMNYRNIKNNINISKQATYFSYKKVYQILLRRFISKFFISSGEAPVFSVSRSV